MKLFKNCVQILTMAFTSNTEEYININLRSLIFDNKVYDMVKQNRGFFPPYLINNIFYTDSFPLDQKRLNRIMSGYDNGLPPVYVQKVRKNMYQLQNGRHRVTATILKGGQNIPGKIID